MTCRSRWLRRRVSKIRKKLSEYLRDIDSSTRWALSYIVPVDHKWFTHLVVAEIIHRTLEKLHLAYLVLKAGQRQTLREARALLEHEMMAVPQNQPYGDGAG